MTQETVYPPPDSLPRLCDTFALQHSLHTHRDFSLDRVASPLSVPPAGILTKIRFGKRALPLSNEKVGEILLSSRM